MERFKGKDMLFVKLTGHIICTEKRIRCKHQLIMILALVGFSLDW